MVAAAGFKLRKIKTADTLGQKFRRARKKLGVDIIEAELKTQVRAKYLEALENDDYEILPNDIYVKGFIATYCKFLGLPAKEMTEEYLREKNLIKDEVKDDFLIKRNIEKRSFTLTPKLLITSFAVLFFVVAVFYIVSQVMGFASVPKLAIDSPKSDQVVDSEKIVVQGQTDQGVDLEINKESVAVDSNGNFSEEISLQVGINRIAVVAKNKADKEANQIFIVERKEKTVLE